MKIWTIQARDEFDRKFNCSQIGPPDNIMVPPNIIYNDVFRSMITAILVEMGHVAKATWTCEEREWYWINDQ